MRHRGDQKPSIMIGNKSKADAMSAYSSRRVIIFTLKFNTLLTFEQFCFYKYKTIHISAMRETLNSFIFLLFKPKKERERERDLWFLSPPFCVTPTIFSRGQFTIFGNQRASIICQYVNFIINIKIDLWKIICLYMMRNLGGNNFY